MQTALADFYGISWSSRETEMRNAPNIIIQTPHCVADIHLNMSPIHNPPTPSPHPKIGLSIFSLSKTSFSKPNIGRDDVTFFGWQPIQRVWSMVFSMKEINNDEGEVRVDRFRH